MFKLVTPEAGPVLPQGNHMNKVGRDPLGMLHTKALRLLILDKKFFKYFAMQPELWAEYKSFNRDSYTEGKSLSSFTKIGPQVMEKLLKELWTYTQQRPITIPLLSILCSREIKKKSCQRENLDGQFFISQYL